jgi:hypothetical protein
MSIPFLAFDGPSDLAPTAGFSSFVKGRPPFYAQAKRDFPIKIAWKHYIETTEPEQAGRPDRFELLKAYIRGRPTR